MERKLLYLCSSDQIQREEIQQKGCSLLNYVADISKQQALDLISLSNKMPHLPWTSRVAGRVRESSAPLVCHYVLHKVKKLLSWLFIFKNVLEGVWSRTLQGRRLLMGIP